MQLTKFTSTILSVKTNPLRDLILEYYPFPHYSFFNYPLPICGRIFEEFRTLQIKLDSIGASAPSSKYLTHSDLAENKLHICQKDNLTPAQWRCQHNAMVQNYPNHNIIYTDGSVCGERGGCGAWGESLSLKARLPDHSSIFSCELYAIYVSIIYSQKSSQPTLILTDSLSATTALKNPHYSKHHLIEKITSLLIKSPPNKFHIQWIPSHTGIPGNDRADQLAKDSLKLTYITQAQYSSGDVHKIISNFYQNKTTKQWLTLNEMSTAPIFLKYPNPPFPFLLSPRQIQVPLTRLHLLVTKFTHQHHFTKEAPKSCGHCNIRNSIYHILIVCPLFCSARQTLKGVCDKMKIPLNVENILKGNFPPQALLDYLNATKTLKKL